MSGGATEREEVMRAVNEQDLEEPGRVSAS